MKITTKYNLGQNVYIYINSLNKYYCGKIERIDALVNDWGSECRYTIKNSYFNRNAYFDDLDSLYGQQYFSRDEEEVFFSLEELENWLEEEHELKMAELSEFKKKGWW